MVNSFISELIPNAILAFFRIHICDYLIIHIAKGLANG